MMYRGKSQPGDVEWFDVVAEVTAEATDDSERVTLLEVKLREVLADLANGTTALEQIAEGVPRKPQWKSADDFMVGVAATLDAAGVMRPDHY